MGVIHPRGTYHVEMPYEATQEVSNGMSHGKRALFGWIKENCAPVCIRATYTIVGRNKEGGIKRKAKFHFLTKAEAVLFKLTWGGNV